MLLRFDPFQEFERLTEEARRPARTMLLFDAIREDDHVVIDFDVPGIDSDHIDVTVEKNELTVTVDRPWGDGDQDIVAAERPHGSFSRQLMLGDTLDVEGLEANVANGVLTVTIPVSEKSKQRKISVGGGSGGSEAIDASSSDAEQGDDS